MQLILDSEPALAIKGDMSAIEDIHTEKVVNGDIEQLDEKNCNGNKENINGDVNVINNDEKNKLVLNAGIGTLPNCSNNESENTEDELSIKVANKQDTVEENNTETNEHTKEEEESQDNGAGEEIQSTSPKNQELEKHPKETVQEAIVEDEEDLISLNQENINEISNIVQNVSEKDETVNVTEEPKIVIEEPVPDVKLNEPAGTVEKDDEHLESSKNEDKHLQSPENNDELLKSSENEDKSSESSDNKHLGDTNKDVEVPVCDSGKEISNTLAGDSSPIELKDDMDVDEVEETTKSEENDTSSQPTEKPSAPVSSSNIDRPILCKLSNTLDILSDDEDEPPKAEPPTEIDSNEKQCINIEDDDDIMLIDEDTSKTKTPEPVVTSNKEDTPITEIKSDLETEAKTVEEKFDLFTKTDEKGQ